MNYIIGDLNHFLNYFFIKEICFQQKNTCHPLVSPPVTLEKGKGYFMKDEYLSALKYLQI